MNTKNIILVKLSALSLMLIVLLLTISARGCSKRSGKTKTGSSNTNTFMINAPSNLTATAVSTSQINLFWQDNSNNEDGFEIERKVWVEGNWQQIATLNSNNMSYTDNTGLLPMTTYYYRIRAYNTIGDRSAYSNEANVVTLVSIWAEITTLGSHVLALTTNGILWSWGINYNGQLGLGFINNYLLSPNPIGTETDWVSVAAGAFHSLAIKTNGTLWSWGANALGQLGMGNTQYENWEPYQIPYPPEASASWVAVTAGYGYTIALRNNGSAQPPVGTIWSWGQNNYGQLGLGYTTDETTGMPTPSQIGTESD
jgi:hypothetical protein